MYIWLSIFTNLILPTTESPVSPRCSTSKQSRPYSNLITPPSPSCCTLQNHLQVRDAALHKQLRHYSN